MPPSICLSARGHARIASPSGFVTGSKGCDGALREEERRCRIRSVANEPCAIAKVISEVRGSTRRDSTRDEKVRASVEDEL